MMKNVIDLNIVTLVSAKSVWMIFLFTFCVPALSERISISTEYVDSQIVFSVNNNSSDVIYVGSRYLDETNLTIFVYDKSREIVYGPRSQVMGSRNVSIKKLEPGVGIVTGVLIDPIYPELKISPGEFDVMWIMRMISKLKGQKFTVKEFSGIIHIVNGKESKTRKDTEAELNIYKNQAARLN